MVYLIAGQECINLMRFFHCEKCTNTFVIHKEDMVREAMVCGVAVGCRYTAEGECIPIGCGGDIKEVTYEQACGE